MQIALGVGGFEGVTGEESGCDGVIWVVECEGTSM